MNQDMPEITSSSYTVTTTAGEQWNDPVRLTGTGKDVFAGIEHKLKQAVEQDFTEENELSKRLVRVLIVDPDELVPVDQSLLHDSKEMLTELDDQELYFEIDIKGEMAAHNERRAKIRDPEVKDREEFLEPVRVRDLRMMVVTIAEF